MPEQPGTIWKLLRRGAAALITAAVLAACGSANSSTTTSTTATAASNTATTTASTATSATSATSPTTSTSATTTTSTTATTVASGAPCNAAGLSLSFLGQQGGMGHGEIGFALKNTSGAPCRTYGWPGILFLDQGGHPLTTIPHHTTNDFFGSTPATPLVIAPGASASFRLDVGHGVATSNGCATAYALQVIPPNDTHTLRTAIPNGAYECQDANVSPLRSGESAYP